MNKFTLVSKYKPCGDQPIAIKRLTEGLQSGKKYQVLLGVTGSGKTFTMANVIEKVNRPVLVISHNKTLAAQLYAEFKEFFPHNAVHYFVSYYDYYQPEAYIPQRDIYIEKDASINENLERLRLAATSSLLSRRDVIIVASVSCIYNLGSPEDYAEMTMTIKKGESFLRRDFLKKLVEMQYKRSETDFKPGSFRLRGGEVIEIFPPYQDNVIRVVFTPPPNSVQEITLIQPLTRETISELTKYTLFPTKHFIIPERKLSRGIDSIRQELVKHLKVLERESRMLEAKRLETRTNYDLEMIAEIGYCKGIENYSRHFSGRLAGQRPTTLIDYFPDDFITFVDESHVTLPQLRGMYNGDRSRKETLIEYGFRLPSALDNRPMKFPEWSATVKQAAFISATPAEYEMSLIRKDDLVEQVIRPTGLVDPPITVKPINGQIDDLLKRISERVKNKERVLITTVTKRLAEELSFYLSHTGSRKGQENRIKSKYLHSEIDTIERVKILNELRSGKFDVLVGVNLLREGLDLPEVSLVAILDADKEGFLRSATSLIQTVGRTARNIHGEVVLYADQMTDSIRKAIEETNRRRNIQLKYNRENNITPRTIKKEILRGIELEDIGREISARSLGMKIDAYDKVELMHELEKEMYSAAEKLDFEYAAQVRDAIARIKHSYRLLPR
ncbi:MAG: excinuclease ABC subunit UvrB [Planctomycetota bacterium]|nr:excinuclease ABC subunit UvrB [Planctomycetota bacterium]MDI6788455.1 excinuclease ABC subunit UvrB [Planctomycetota bacterium]